MKSVSVIVPTTGRDTLQATVDSVTAQLHAQDELVVCGDPGPLTSTLNRMSQCRLVRCAPGRNWGASERQQGIQQAIGSHLAFLDDDDIYLPRALTHIHDAIERHPDQPILGRMLRNGDVLWRGPEFLLGNISTQMIIVPNDPLKLGIWTDEYACDFRFLASSLWAPANFVWLSEILVHCRPHHHAHDPFLRDFGHDVHAHGGH